MIGGKLYNKVGGDKDETEGGGEGRACCCCCLLIVVAVFDDIGAVAVLVFLVLCAIDCHLPKYTLSEAYEGGDKISLGINLLDDESAGSISYFRFRLLLLLFVLL